MEQFDNTLRYTDTLVDPQEMLEIINSEKRESMSFLKKKSGFRINDTELPHGTIATISALDAIESPFIIEKQSIQLSDVIKALYVICNTEEAVDIIFNIENIRKAVLSTASMAEKAPEFYQIYLNKLEELSSAETQLDICANTFAMQLGTLNPGEAIAIIGDYLKLCFTGFTFIPNPEDGESDKKKDTTQSGSQVWFPWLRKLYRVVKNTLFLGYL